MPIKHATTVDIGDLRTLSKPIHLMQYDKSLPEIEVHITKDGQEYTIPSGYSATIRWGKPDKHGCTATGTVSGSTVTFQVTEQMACVAGRSKVTVEIVESDSSQAGTAKFDVIVDSNPIGDNTIVSDSEIADIQKAIEAGQNAELSAKSASQSATNASNSAKEAKASADSAELSAKSASQSATNASNSAKEAKASADSVANVVSDVSQLKEDLGNKSNLNTDDKTNIVNAINEVNNRFISPVSESVTDWLNAHPEATTTVQDYSLTITKMAIGTLGYVTPEMFGAVGDGTTDDTEAIKKAIEIGKPILFGDKIYCLTDTVNFTNSYLFGCGNTKTIIKTVSQTTAREHQIHISGKSIIKDIQFLQENETSLVGLFNTSYTYFDNCYFKVTNKTNGYVDLYTNNHDVHFTNCIFECDSIKNDILQIGGIWVRESTKGAESYNIYFSNCTILHNTIDECLGIWDWNGTVHDVIIDSCIIKAKDTCTSPHFISLDADNCLLSNSVIYAPKARSDSVIKGDKYGKVSNCNIIFYTDENNGISSGYINFYNCYFENLNSICYLCIQKMTKFYNCEFNLKGILSSRNLELYGCKVNTKEICPEWTGMFTENFKAVDTEFKLERPCRFINCFSSTDNLKFEIKNCKVVGASKLLTSGNGNTIKLFISGLITDSIIERYNDSIISGYVINAITSSSTLGNLGENVKTTGNIVDTVIN